MTHERGPEEPRWYGVGGWCGPGRWYGDTDVAGNWLDPFGQPVVCWCGTPLSDVNGVQAWDGKYGCVDCMEFDDPPPRKTGL